MKIVIVDDHAVFRRGLKQVLAALPDCTVVGEAGTARTAFPIIDAERPDVVVLDMLLPGMDGCAAARELARRLPEARLMVLTARDSPEEVFEALGAGVLGYVLKSDPIPVLQEALRAVFSGERYLSPALAGLNGGAPPDGSDSSGLSALSLREREVFHLAARGLANMEIARELCISRKTVETHKYRLQKKLGLHNARDLLQYAATHGLIRRARRELTE